MSLFMKLLLKKNNICCDQKLFLLTVKLISFRWLLLLQRERFIVSYGADIKLIQSKKPSYKKVTNFQWKLE